MLVPIVGFADSWLAPTTEVVASPIGKFLARIEPSSGKDVDTEQKCRALIYRFENKTSRYKLTKTIYLANPVRPVDTLIRDDGRYLITFDDYYSTGYGKNVIVIYDLTKGKCFNLSLANFLSEVQIESFPETTSSKHWRGMVNLMNDQRYVYIAAALDLMDDKKKHPSFILDIEKMKVEIDTRK